MAKKRNKRYQGKDAKRQQAKVRKISVDDTSKLQRWWKDHKSELTIRGVQLGFVVVVGLVVWGIISLIF